MASLQLDIVTPENKVLSTTTDYVGIPGIEGALGIMANHVPLLSALAVGSLHYFSHGDKPTHVFISGGFAEVSHNKVTILAEAAEVAGTIDEARAQAAKERAERRLAERQDNINILRAEAALSRAIQRLAIVQNHQHK